MEAHSSPTPQSSKPPLKSSPVSAAPLVAPPRKAIAVVRMLPMVILSACFLGWSMSASIPVKIVGQSIILVPRSKVEFQTRSSGRLIQLNVKVGDKIRRGQVLGLLEASELREELANKQQELAEYIAENIQITAIERQRSQLKTDSLGREQNTVPIQIRANLEQIRSNKQEQVAIARQRKTYEERLQQIDEIDKLIAARFEAYNTLVAEGAVAPLDPNRIQAEDVLQKNLNEKTQLLAKLEDLRAKTEQLAAQNESLTAQNNHLNAQLENLSAQQSEISLDDLESDTKRRNKIDNLRRDIENLRVKLEDATQIVSEQDGEVISLAANLGQFLQTGDTLGMVRVTEANSTPKIALAFFTPEDSDRIAQGMAVEVTPNLLTERRFGGARERFGGIVGTVQAVSQETMTPAEVTSLVGNPQLAEALMTNPIPYTAPDPGEASNLPVVQVAVELERNPNNVTGYEWVSGKEPNVPLPEGAIGVARVTVEERSPFNYLMPLLRWITGIYHR